LGKPDEQELGEFTEAYENLVGSGSAFKVADTPPGPPKDLIQDALHNQRRDELRALCDRSMPGFLFSLKGEWYPCNTKWPEGIWFYPRRNVNFSARVEAGMSGMGTPSLTTNNGSVALVSLRRNLSL
jgi:hypothetical protein